MVCQGNELEYCGGPLRLNLYKYDDVVPPPTNPDPNPDPNPNPGETLPPVTEGLPTTWHYAGCYV